MFRARDRSDVHVWESFAAVRCSAELFNKPSTCLASLPYSVDPFFIIKSRFQGIVKKWNFTLSTSLKLKKRLFVLLSEILTRNCWDVISFHRLFCPHASLPAENCVMESLFFSVLFFFTVDLFQLPFKLFFCLKRIRNKAKIEQNVMVVGKWCQ